MYTAAHYNQTDSMLCSRCNKETPVRSLRLDLTKYRIESAADIERLDCKVCNNFIAIKAITTTDTTEMNRNEIIININDVKLKLDEEDEKELLNCWQEAVTVKEKIIYYALSQIIYPKFDTPNSKKYESIYDFADETDLVMLRWERGIPIGFYTLKLKGSKILTTNEEYAMPTLDTAYIRSEYRNRGIGTEILMKIIEMFPNEDIGLSRPISEGMWKILKRFLTTHKEHRLKFWEIEEGGNEGNRKLVWFTLMKNRKSN